MRLKIIDRILSFGFLRSTEGINQFVIPALRLLYNPVPTILKMILPDLSIRIPIMQLSYLLNLLR